IELAGGDAIPGRGDALGLVGFEETELGVHARCGRLDAAEPTGDRRRDRLARDREVGYRLVRLPTPESVAGDASHPAESSSPLQRRFVITKRPKVVPPGHEPQ